LGYTSFERERIDFKRGRFLENPLRIHADYSISPCRQSNYFCITSINHLFDKTCSIYFFGARSNQANET